MLAFGNCVVLKPADLVPGCGWALAETISHSRLPDGVFNLVMGRGAVVGEAILNSPDVNSVCFTGSVPTGKHVAKGSVPTGKHVAKVCSARGAKFQLELGGKNPMFVLDDANLDVAVDACVNGVFFSTGQRCMASSRFIAAEGIHDQFVAAVTAKLEGLVIGDATKAGTHIGHVVDQSHLTLNLEYIEIGKSEGAKLVCGGEQVTATPMVFI